MLANWLVVIVLQLWCGSSCALCFASRNRKTGVLMWSKAATHVKCRNGVYPSSLVQRFPVEDAAVSWLARYDNYQPNTYESPTIKKKIWSDPELDADEFIPRWNRLDGQIDRRSYTGLYEVVDGVPLNPRGRTGIIGRGLLGRWGPNHAADPIVTRWKRECTSNAILLHPVSLLPVLQFCAIQRHDNNEWAIPGGMVDPGEEVSTTLMREFMEEAMNSSSKENLPNERYKLAAFFANGTTIYRGYVDDPRNTDNAWIETVAVNFHDDEGTKVGKFALNAGDDAKRVKWMDIDHSKPLYASHAEFIENVANLWKAHF